MAKNRAQSNYFRYLEDKGKMPKMSRGGMVGHLEYGDEEAEHDDEMMPHFAEGGMVSDNYDYREGHASEFDSSGEPHTEDEMEDEHPMEYMAYGGRAPRKMSGGGMAGRSKFVKALRMGR